MLVGLSIHNIVLIDRLDLAPEDGLTVLTGETGAGKSILLDSLDLALGARGDPSLLRHGADQGSVTAEFSLAHHHPALAILNEEVQLEARCSEFLGEGPSGHFLRRGETSPFVSKFLK